MTEKRKFEFFLLRYVPHAIRQRYVDFGVILRERGVEGGFAGVRFAPNWRAIRDLDPRADVEILEALEREIRGQIESLQERDVLIRWLEDTHSNIIQVTPATACLAHDPVSEMESLVRAYLSDVGVTPVGEGADRQKSSRRLILEGMQQEFERFGVWKLLRHGISVGEYTKTTDSYKFDFGYHAGGKIKMFHAVSLDASMNPALDLASKYRKITREKAATVPDSFLLTAVTEDNVDHADERIAYVMRAMENDGIEIVGLAKMPKIAEAARVELKA